MKPRTIVLFLILIGFGLRVHGLNVQPLWGDEGWSFYFAHMPPAEMLDKTAEDIHPPLYYLLLHAWLTLAGPGPEIARFLSVVFGTLMIAVGWVFVRGVLGGWGWFQKESLTLSPNPSPSEGEGSQHHSLSLGGGGLGRGLESQHKPSHILPANRHRYHFHRPHGYLLQPGSPNVWAGDVAGLNKYHLLCTLA